jgi:hypothetical protein
MRRRFTVRVGQTRRIARLMPLVALGAACTTAPSTDEKTGQLSERVLGDVTFADPFCPDQARDEIYRAMWFGRVVTSGAAFNQCRDTVMRSGVNSPPIVANAAV